MARQANKFLIALAALGFIAGPALADHLYPQNEPYYNSLSRSDFIALNAGDAPQSNIAIQTPTPWPEYVNDTHIHTDGIVSEQVIQQFFARHAPAATAPAPAAP